jgi:pimeloyl-ACP methyl ester carboxylesterase
MITEKEIQFKNTSGYYTVEGNGEPIMLVHGFCGEGAVWNEMKRFLPKDYTLIIPDLPGYGNSNIRNSASEIISIEYYAEYLSAIADKENLQQFMLIGHSMGGYTVLAFAEMFPEKLKKLCLFHSHPYEDDATKKENRRKSIRFIEKYGTKLFTDELFNTLFAPAFYEQQPEAVKHVKEMVKKYPPRTLISSCEAMIARKDRSDVMKNISASVLLIIGRQDNAIDYDKSLAMCSLASVTELHILQHVGHMGMLEAPEQTAQMICNFIEKL